MLKKRNYNKMLKDNKDLKDINKEVNESKK